MTREVETIIVGGGQAGLSTSYFLGRRGRENVILEQAARPANAWRNDRWDSFTFVTPNWTFRLPGAAYDGPSPDGFMTRDEIIGRFENYVERYQLPVEYEVRVTGIEANAAGRRRYLVRTAGEILAADNVVIATGMFQRPRIPASASALSPSISQLHSGQYRNPHSLPPGAVLVAGSGQSGCQIAEELYQSGRKVYLCVGRCGRAPRRYRDRDIFEWLDLTGFLDRTADMLPSVKAKFAANPQVTGRDGGHTLNLHQFARDGVGLLGRFEGGQGTQIRLAADLHENLAGIDRFEVDLLRMIDAYVTRSGLDAPEETLPALRDGYEAELITNMDLSAAGVSTIIWAMGYQFDFSLAKFPVLDDDGYPVQKWGVTDFPGLYFVGLPWLQTQKSGLLLGVGENAAHIASAIAG